MRKEKVLTGVSIFVFALLFSSNIVLAKPTVFYDKIQKTVASMKQKKRAAEPDVYNQKEFYADEAKTLNDFTMNLLFGGLHYYNGNYAKKIPNGRVKITANGNGIFYFTNALSSSKVTLYDAKNKKLAVVGSEYEYVKAGVKKGEVFYVQLPKKIDELCLDSGVFQDHLGYLTNDDAMLQSGTGKKVYCTFKVSKRSYASISCKSMNENAKIYGQIQKYENKKWKSISKVAQIQEDGINAGLTKGSYRVSVSAKKGQVYTLGYNRITCLKKYVTKKSKAQKVYEDDFRFNVYLPNETASRWYVVKKKTTRKGECIALTDAVNSGKLKIQVYQKGVKKQKYKAYVGPSNNGGFASYNLPKKKGTYYIKISKIGKQTNGGYNLFYLTEN